MSESNQMTNECEVLVSMPNDCMYEVCLNIMRTSRDWKGLLAIMVTRKEWRMVVLDILRTCKWDTLMLDRGKVQLERLAIACSFPEVRERAMRYVQGKTKFLYKGIVLQLNRAQAVSSLHITCANSNAQLRFTTVDDSAAKGRPVYGGSVMHGFKKFDKWFSVTYDIPWDNLRKALNFLNKLKPLPPQMLEQACKLRDSCENPKPDTGLHYWGWVGKQRRPEWYD